MNFFEYIQNASIEKVHSQFIAWLFSKNNQAISDNQKIELLNLFAGNGFDKNDKITDVFTEKNKIDVTIELEKQVVVIENKIKISQRINQLNDYQTSTDKSYPNRRKHYVLLSLVDEEPDSAIWNKCTYIEFLEKGLNQLNFSEHSDKYILKEYIKGLSSLTNAITSFISNPEKMSGVFTESNKKKYQKSIKEFYSDAEKYILRNNLEAICQKHLYSLIIKEEKDNFYLPIITETRGNALIDLKKPKDIKPLKINGYEFDFGIQIQKGSIKVQIESGYEVNGERKRIPKRTMSAMSKTLLSHGNRIYREVERFKPEYSWRYNKTKSKTAPKAYMSVSKKIDFSDDKEFYHHNLDELKNAFSTEIARCKKIIKHLSEYDFNKKFM